MPKKLRKPKKFSDHTTIWIRKETLERLSQVSKRGESYDKLLQRILSGQGEVWVEVLAVDGNSPAKHQVLFKLGDYHYFWDGKSFAPVDSRKVKAVVAR